MLKGDREDREDLGLATIILFGAPVIGTYFCGLTSGSNRRACFRKMSCSTFQSRGLNRFLLAGCSTLVSKCPKRTHGM